MGKNRSLREDFREKPERPGALRALRAAWGEEAGWEVAASLGLESGVVAPARV